MTEKSKYSEEQKKRMEKFVVGGKDYSDEPISKIFYKADEYVIYGIETDTPSNSIKIQIDTIDEFDKTLTDRFDIILSNFTKIKGLLYKVNYNNSIKARISYALSLGLNGNVDKANEQLIELITEINSEYSNQFKNRLVYIITVLFLTLISIGISLFVYSDLDIMIKPEIETLLYVLSGGCIGCFLSISIGIKKTIIEKEIDWYFYIIYGFERIFISIFGAIVLYFAIKSNLVFGIANQLDKPVIGYFLFAVVAGFSENLIPSLLTKLEKEN